VAGGHTNVYLYCGNEPVNVIATAEPCHRGRAIGGAIGGAIGSAVGATIGSMLVPGLGTWIGGTIGGFVGSALGQYIGSQFDTPTAQEQRRR
jgi:phage tail tape-measure protein